MSTQVEYFEQLVAAFIRGRLPLDQCHAALFNRPLDELSFRERQTLIELARDQELRLHRFKRTMELPRVRKVLGILNGLQPRDLLDIGSGRGAFYKRSLTLRATGWIARYCLIVSSRVRRCFSAQMQ